MHFRLVDRSGRRLKNGDVVKVIEDRDILAVFFDDSDIILPPDLDDCLGACGRVLETDASDSSVKIALTGISKQYWFPVAGLESPDKMLASPARVVNTLSESIALELTEQLFQDEEFKDVTFSLKDCEVRAHKNILAASSHVFSAMLTDTGTEARESVIRLPAIHGSSMRTFLRLLYTGHVDPADWKAKSTLHADSESGDSGTLPIQILLEIAKLAKMYMVEGVMQIVVETVKNRLRQLQEDDAETIQIILAAAISDNLGPIRTAAIVAAKESSVMRDLYTKQRLLAEVQTELQAIWPPPPRTIKRRRLE
eukprot:TRINITY_DN32002_c0_g1_i1.p1 TRINITY_DN32002_c0_g1~~TRINITY_DN32002_c0_g1_i1.p1  ORF type:complete len:327 (+),score=51.18 TRINITY_DN32002_c0_g1_i1:53-982(+)